MEFYNIDHRYNDSRKLLISFLYTIFCVINFLIQPFKVQNLLLQIRFYLWGKIPLSEKIQTVIHKLHRNISWIWYFAIIITQKTKSLNMFSNQYFMSWNFRCNHLQCKIFITYQILSVMTYSSNCILIVECKQFLNMMLCTIMKMLHLRNVTTVFSHHDEANLI